jgi:flagellar biosynthesis protein
MGRKKAVALKYDRESGKKDQNAPIMVAKGAGVIAEEILRRAREAEVYIHEDEDLVEVLSQLGLGDEIPPELYEAVAKILALVYRLNKNFSP